MYEENTATYKAVEERLRRSEDKFSKVFHSNPEIMTISNLETGRYLDVNKAFEDTIGYSREEAIGRTAFELNIWVDTSEREYIVKTLLEGKQVRNYEPSIRTKSGRILTALLSSEIIWFEDQQCLLSTVSDITERKNAEIERENARKALEEVYERERRIAETLQRSFLPDSMLIIDGYQLADAYYPALAEAAIGGDVYDVFRLPNGKVGLVVADVSGKGLRAARYGAMVKYALRAYSYVTDDPAQALAMLNNLVIADIDAETFITCFFGILDPPAHQFTYANAGHDEPLYVSHKSGLCGRLHATGCALGLYIDTEYTHESVTLKTNDIIFLYTDGVTDARGVEDRMDVEGFEEFLVSKCALSAKSLVHCVVKEVMRRSGDQLADDVAILALEVM